MKKNSVIIIGGGPGGYVSAIRLAQLNIDVAVIEKERLGGVCLNHGCIPTKSMVKVAELFSEIKEAENFGISVENSSIDYQQIFDRKNKVVDRLVSGVEFIFKKRKIPVFKENVLKIRKEKEGYKIITDQAEYIAEYIVIATGSLPKQLPFLKFDGRSILSSRDILKLRKLPKKLVVIGGGVIGCEFASIFNKLGSEVEIVELLPTLVFNEDPEISKRLSMYLKKSGIKLYLKTSLTGYENDGEYLKLKLSDGKEMITEKILVSVGRDPNLFIDFENCDPGKDKGFIKIDEKMKTNIPKVFAIGDITGKLMLAHTASKQGLIAVEVINSEINKCEFAETELLYENIPKCTFTDPEIGSVGLTEEQAKDKFGDILIGKFPFSANGKALGSGNTNGFVKVIADKSSHKIIGMHILGPNAAELIAQGSILIGTNSTIGDVKNIVFAHPTLSECIMEAIEDLEKSAIHKM